MPIGHAAQLVTPSELLTTKKPGAHTVQAAAETLPVCAVYCPAGHAVQLDEPNVLL